MNWKAKWIAPIRDLGSVAPIFRKTFSCNGKISRAVLHMTALGTYEATLNGQRISDYVLAPGWTCYQWRLQYQTYDITAMLKESNSLEILLGNGWYRSRIPHWDCDIRQLLHSFPAGLLAQLEVEYANGRQEMVCSDESWQVSESCIRFSDLYDGEVCDGNMMPDYKEEVHVFDGPSHTLIPQEGAPIKEQEQLQPVQIFTTPKGEVVIDFGQNMTGYVQTSLTAKAGEEVCLSFGEVLDAEGNFYNTNYRSAKAMYRYICRDGQQVYKPKTTFWGFRYARIDRFPGGCQLAKPENFIAIVVHSDLKRTGWLSCSDPTLNQFFRNVLWGQKSNFLDIPTDCPQRDERFGWTGDAQVFIRTACRQYDCQQFYTKWLGDVRQEQLHSGYVADYVPDLRGTGVKPYSSAAWADAATICPWEFYMAYGNPELLKKHFAMMRDHVDYITRVTTTPDLWAGGIHFGDWLSMDCPEGSRRGGSRWDLIASAFYAHSTSLLVKAGKVLGEDVGAYELLHSRIVAAFRKAFPTYLTQTEHVLAVHFCLAEDPQKTADDLVAMLHRDGGLKTGFVGTPYLLYVLSQYGYADLAWSLLLKKDCPSWLYQVTMGATTVWEHWDGILPNGSIEAADMTSFNHYAYGSVVDWVYGVAAGIRETAPGYAAVQVAPMPDARLDWLQAEQDTPAGRVSSYWCKTFDGWRYEITVPVEAEIVIAGKQQTVPAGSYVFYSN